MNDQQDSIFDHHPVHPDRSDLDTPSYPVSIKSPQLPTPRETDFTSGKHSCPLLHFPLQSPKGTSDDSNRVAANRNHCDHYIYRFYFRLPQIPLSGENV
jgi:hypothetical protein